MLDRLAQNDLVGTGWESDDLTTTNETRAIRCQRSHGSIDLRPHLMQNLLQAGDVVPVPEGSDKPTDLTRVTVAQRG